MYDVVKKFLHKGLGVALAGVFVLPLQLAQAQPQHAYALWGEPKYPPGFTHFEYANPQAPKGGELRMVSNWRVSAFDKYNPFTIRGSAPAYLQNLLFESLLTASLDETATGYGLLAESIDVAPDRLSATFIIRPEARFHNGKPVLAEDVKHSFEMLISAKASPGYATMFADVKEAVVLGERVIRFDFKVPNRELPLTVGGMPVFSRDWGVVDGVRKPFDEITMEVPIASGPYRVGKVEFGRDITYERDKNYWGQALNVNQGMHNFDRIFIPIYKDNTARLEALKAGAFDAMQFVSAGDWARRTAGRKFESGQLRKVELEHRNPSGFQSYLLNVRRPFLSDVRVRQALELAMDYEWLNRRLFYGSYSRVHGLFGNTACKAEGAPSPQELRLLEPWRAQLQESVFAPIQPPPATDGERSLRDNLMQAQALLTDAGWTLQNGVLRNAKGQALTLEYLTSGEAAMRVVTPWMRNLEKLGITLKYRSVDYAVYVQRLRSFDFDITSMNLQGTHNPGQEYAELFGSAAADAPDSGNYTGIKNEAVDAIIKALVHADKEEDFLAACRALERVIVSERILIPQWYSAVFRLVYNANKLAYQGPMPPHTQQLEGWIMSAWWHR